MVVEDGTSGHDNQLAPRRAYQLQGEPSTRCEMLVLEDMSRGRRALRQKFTM